MTAPEVEAQMQALFDEADELADATTHNTVGGLR